ncbi:lysophospholipid acyltransferase family protein [Alloscardovia theropitheci]|nr:lysophospholipid acyltransferase family protein [Alloscardovia theropitheci]
MFIGGIKRPVIANIEKAHNDGRFNDRVEIHDPVIHKEDRTQLTLNHLRYVRTFRYRINNRVARSLYNIFGWWNNRTTQFVGLENARKVKTGAIITSNHFNPLENLTVLQGMRRAGHLRNYVVSEDSNFLMQGFIGFMMKNIDTVPITKSHDYLSHQFPAIIRQILAHKRFILIYPEEQMWFNYRRPRPNKHGAFDYAAEFGVPIIPCFTEIIDTGKPDKETTEFNKVRYVLHILDPIYPDPSLSVAQNSEMMRQKDYEQKVACYESVYGKSIDAPFSLDDIAGWTAGDPSIEPQDSNAEDSNDKDSNDKVDNLANPFAA